MDSKVRFNYYFYFLISTATVACGNLRSFKTSKFPIMAYNKDSFSIATDNCNLDKCTNSNSILHLRLKAILTKFLNKSGFLVINNSKDAKYKIHIVTAFENSIDELHPRNIYFILKDKGSDEIFQFGISENYSTTLNRENISFIKLEKLFTQNLIATISNANSFQHLANKEPTNK